MHPTRPGKPVLNTVMAVARAAVGAGAATAKPWRCYKTGERGTEPRACLHELTAQMRRSGSDTDLLTSHGSRPS